MYNFYLIGLSEVSRDSALIESKIESFADRLTVAWQTVALGMVIVFAVLASLWLILEIAGRRMSKSSSKAPKKVEVHKSEPETVAAPVVSEEVPVDSGDEGEIVAAITAAISLMLEAEGKPSKGFRVVSFKRNGRGAHWNR
jgi:sodium pump decarboxylase gamma subunit